MDWSNDFPSANRWQNMKIGFDLLNQWLNDVLQVGIANYAFSTENLEPIASRLTDTQLPRLASILRNLPEQDLGADNWESIIQQKLSLLLLLSRSYSKWDSWNESQKLSLLQQLGYNIRTKSLIQQSNVFDRLWIYAVEYSEEKNLRRRICYVYALSHRQFFGIIDFAFGRNSFELELTSNLFIATNVHIYPNPTPWRVHITGVTNIDTQEVNIAYYADFASMKRAYTQAIIDQPWLYEWPCAIQKVRILYDESHQVRLVDNTGHQLNISNNHKMQVLELVSFALQQPIDIIGLFRDNMLYVQHAKTENRSWFLTLEG